ncbi:ribonuclease P protein component [Goodfellowiella coeruleoviolacea]|uniref:Ribonuclease P protein component n=1 Tax=Goodfellowiella coeruleoviolacea TaxID=334858 RepID=A0AAE3KJE0_9PSEU|nr:ribonuclease P protein component [Goodfellowiella coeruleoviolacea]
MVHALTAPAVPGTEAAGPGTADGTRPHDTRRDDTPTLDGPSTRVGFVVSKAVGNAVIRHRVARKLRHLMRDRLDALPPGTRLVVRALPAAATSTSAELGADLDGVFRRLRLLAPPAQIEQGGAR